ncbi:MAG TPA: alpha/beta hydrolase [Phenylobacterium sp.]|jgi:pimeloyl-ACP methyl ester carboxylesterase|uniref:alpha/beta hydrolase family protein n=1 Tax=Phenylobacterium sp. TaxID=1871053 RepID=UPI002D2849BB|nr:alpha/beta hydrolase [Phenylobacterium sp.]HZZ66911.1 alpha/beta hydrolase [Phenylobacterium sp.]
MRRAILAGLILGVAIGGVSPLAATAKAVGHPAIPAAIFTDPPADAAHPPRMEVLHIPSGGVEINGVAYLAGGAGVHPTVVLLHGLPGNEKNLDLAQAIRRAGWNVVTFNFRGSWGSPGAFSFEGNLADAKAVLAFVRDPAHAGPLQIDTHRLVLAGHSMGGWVTALTAAQDDGLAGAVLICAADMAGRGATAAAKPMVVKSMAENMESLAGTSPEKMADEVIAISPRLSFNAQVAKGLATKPVLVLTSDDGLAPNAEKLVKAIEADGSHAVTLHHEATDHSWSGKRIALEAAVISWLQGLK